ncbi:hypothetical protein AGABI2DRAFT_191596 [Agaricus bisporus var. bisporus H97]|uniref:hypothetical protein n=1 Tax=Agaricus bisporus var. bisporus (strain H97 / ATCC MYA-4626 / FGSC 10389) TaxID=936046 RepID=UPI00029F71BD|nr:hypothetical protein AGABI2DRAFT_191596 [Agaricus bisporus var. bisporus H97]EKV47869.1 hypothetical protein AGABI2DRAFT_191596 [Agaricus bisporus var. bisporus H97]
MSLSVDDLVSSLNASHIGQEAIDIAALQAQLAQALFGQPPPRHSSQTCTTPTARTPSASMSFSRTRDDYMDEDERMVEELLVPASPSAPPSATYQYSNAYQSSDPPASTHHVHPSDTSMSSSSSVFASTDPFYLAAMQQQQQQQQSASFFAQGARVSQNSPFFARQSAQHRDNHHPLTLDTHSIFASAAY